MWHELFLAVRGFRRSPGLVANLGLTIGLGIGATVAVLVLLADAYRPAGRLPESNRLVIVQNSGLYFDAGSAPKGIVSAQISGPDFNDLTNAQHSFAPLGGFTDDRLAVMTGADRPRTVCRIFVTPQTLDVLGVKPTRGRLLQAADFVASAAGVAIVSDGVWRENFNADPSIVGRPIMLDEQPFIVAGVLPVGAVSVLQPRTALVEKTASDQCVVTPIVRGLGGEAERVNQFLERTRDAPWLNVVGRLRSGVSASAADGDLSSISARLSAAYPTTNRNRSMHDEAFEAWRTADLRSLLTILAVAGLLTFLVACAGAAGLLMTEAVRRGPEFATLYALGAGRSALAGAALARSIVWCLPGAAVGVLFGELTLDVIRWGASGTGAPMMAPHVGPLVVFASLALAVVAGTAGGGMVAWMLRRRNLADLLREGGTTLSVGRRRRRTTRALIAAQIAAATSLAGGAVLLVESMRNLNAVDYGFDVDHGFVVQMRLPRSTYPTSTDQARYFSQTLDRVRHVPDVKAAGVSSSPPLANVYVVLSGNLVVWTPSGSHTLDRLSAQYITAGFFESLGTPPVKGRLLSSLDEASGAPVVIVDETFAKRYIAAADPLASNLVFGSTSFQIVGVVPDMRHAIATDAPDTGSVYMPFVQFARPPTWSFLVVHTSGTPDAVAANVLREMAVVDGAVVLGDPQTFTRLLSAKTADRRRILALLLSFAVIVALLTAESVTASVGQFVALHVREIAIRVAIGAERRHIIRITIGGLLWALATGLAIGIGGAWMVGRALTSQLYGVTATDPSTLGIVIAVLAGIAVIAAARPLWSALRVNPVLAIRGS